MAKKQAAPAASRWEIQPGDGLRHMAKLAAGSIPLICVDPPFNIGRDYDKYDDNKKPQDYLAWCLSWIKEIHRVLDKHGTFWLAIGDKYVSELDVAAKHVGFHKRSHVVWVYSFGVNCAQNFTKSHTHLLYYTKHRDKYTFNASDPQLRIPSARQLTYNDKRANAAGRLPDDTWILQPRQLDPYCDTWLESRICGTFKERVPEVDNQMPLPILERIIRATSKPGDLVLDPMCGSGTTGHAALRTGRRFLGYELSPAVTKKARARLLEASKENNS